MIISAKYIVDKTTDPVIDFYALNSNNPMFSESELNFLRVLRGKAKSAKQMLSRFKKTGDVYKYLKSIIKGNDESTAKKFREFGLVPFEDIIEDFKIVFKDELNDITTIEDFIIEEEYTTWDVIFLAETYRAQSYGILKAKNNMGEVEGIVIRGMFDSEANNYANSWINDDELMYHLIGKDSKTNHINNKELLSGKYPIYVFETIDSNRQVYRGKFTLKKYNQNTHQVHLIRLTGSINLEKTPQIKEYHLPTRSKFTKQIDRRDAIKSGTSIISKNKIESGIKAEKEVLNFFNDIQVHMLLMLQRIQVFLLIFFSVI